MAKTRIGFQVAAGFLGARASSVSDPRLLFTAWFKGLTCRVRPESFIQPLPNRACRVARFAQGLVLRFPSPQKWVNARTFSKKSKLVENGPQIDRIIRLHLQIIIEVGVSRRVRHALRKTPSTALVKRPVYTSIAPFTYISYS